jgi:hypothetical protein
MAADPSVIDAFRKAGRTTGASRKVMKALFEAGLVESNLQNLNHGDRDSLGPLQQRPSQGWKNARDPYKGALDFLKQAIPLADKYGSAGQLAQAVQRSAFPGRYDERSGEATKYLKGAGGGSDATPGPTDTPEAQSAPSQPNMVEALGSLLPQRPQLQVTGPSAPSFAASSALPQGYQAPQAQGAAAPQRDLTPALQAIDRLRQSATQSVGAQTEAHGAREPTANTHLSGSKVLELIFNDGGKGYGIKNGADVDGRQVYSDVWGGHANHVHVAAGPKTVVALGKIAQDKFGLHVGENPHFGGVDAGAHVPGSYHVRDEAIDVSGDPKKMAAYARYVREYNRSRRQ